ncbi:uncharacterized protein LOC133316828 [Gastrolobium bilobum]|uniref:uncharacterized protein LOC133316828 n=1 Tax=Gastrolobium bilobum TaxID=150636 RepID=UPI002AB04788|nr:uncharacterized protein LOC133316828 [Gastrolobium bilobum]
MEHRKRLESKKRFRKQSSMEVFREVRHGPRFGNEFLESFNDSRSRTTCHLKSPKVIRNCDYEVMLESECKFKKIPKPAYFNRWINLRVPFHEVFGDMRCNLKKAVGIARLEWEGRAHSGIDDAKNTARLLAIWH